MLCWLNHLTVHDTKDFHRREHCWSNWWCVLGVSERSEWMSEWVSVWESVAIYDITETVCESLREYVFQCRLMLVRVACNVLRLLCVNVLNKRPYFLHNIIIGPSLTVCFSLYQSVGGSKHCFVCFQTDVQLNENQLTANRWINCFLF